MLSVNLLQRYFDASEFEKAVRILASNGTPAPLPLQARLAFPAPATGLMLRRLVELTYAATALSRSMTTLLIHLQRPDGSFAGSSERCPLATAAAAAGLAAVARHHGPSDGADAEAALHRALAALASMQDDHGLLGGPDDRTTADRALASAYALTVLADEPALPHALRLADLVGWFEEHHTRLDRPTHRLLELARAKHPAVTDSAALRAIAA